MLYASRLGYVRKCTEHYAGDFFLKKASDVLQINVVTSEFFLLSLVESTGTFHVYLIEICEKSDIFTEVSQVRVYNSN